MAFTDTLFTLKIDQQQVKYGWVIVHCQTCILKQTETYSSHCTILNSGWQSSSTSK